MRLLGSLRVAQQLQLQRPIARPVFVIGKPSLRH